MTARDSRPCLALPFTFLTSADQVRLVAGEDLRYTLTGPQIEQWLPDWLASLDGSRTLTQALAELPENTRESAGRLASRLLGERVLVDGPACAAHVGASYRLLIEGSGPLYDSLASLADQADRPPLRVLCQDRLDYEEALRFNASCLQGKTPWLWLSWGALQRGYVSPVFLPDAGPCLACLLGHFQQRSPLPEVYDELRAHARQGKPIAPLPFPVRGQAILRELLLWKVVLLKEPVAPAALYQLHVLETATLEVTAHRVFAAPECSACRSRA
jgi:bacteriocin biosynthesis cyclodehydratase domain-containing protein